MAFYLPSEIARLVYGYLLEEGSFTAAQAFLETSIHLQECYAASCKGKKFSTQIMGRNLVRIFDLLHEVSVNALEIAETMDCSYKLEKLQDLIKLLKVDDEEKSAAPVAHSGNITSTSPEVENSGELVTIEQEQIGKCSGVGVKKKSCMKSSNSRKCVSNEDGSKCQKNEEGSEKNCTPESSMMTLESIQRDEDTISSISNGVDSGGEVLLKKIKPENDSEMMFSSPATPQQLLLGANSSHREDICYPQSHNMGEVFMSFSSFLCESTPWSSLLQKYQASGLPPPRVHMKNYVPPNKTLCESKQSKGMKRVNDAVKTTLKKTKSTQPKPTPKLRPIAPKMVQENGINSMNNEVSSIINSSVYLSQLTNKLSNTENGAHPPPSPVFVDCQDIKH